jgi:hypothetical protein
MAPRTWRIDAARWIARDPEKDATTALFFSRFGAAPIARPRGATRAWRDGMRTTVFLLAAIVAGCGGEPTTTFGPPNGIAGRTPPEPTATATGAPTGSGTASHPPPGGNEAGAPTAGGTEAGSPPPANDAGGGTMVQACAVSWSTGVYPLLRSTGPGQCGSTQCHGGSSTPSISDSDSAATYATLAAFTLNGLAYIAAGDSNPGDSAIECNLGITPPACGALSMPAAPGSLSSTNLQTIDAWIRCGAPQN